LARLLPLIGPASSALARYEGVLAGVPNADVLLSPLTTQEAVLSSKIEGTQVTMGEVLEFEAGGETPSAEKRADIQEVINHRAALHEAERMMKDIPLSQRIVKGAHAALMKGVRGYDKSPGEYRRLPVCIGPKGCTEAQARFVPLEAQHILAAMQRWEQYLHESAPDLLLQSAILHVEFEAIHPFLDGNGRIGRLLVPLFLVEKKLLSGPRFSVSASLEAHRDEYYDRLLAVSRDNDWTGWCAFFLTAIADQARSNESKARAILNLYTRKKDWIADATHSQHAVRALDWFFKQPIFKTPDFIASSRIPKPTASRIVKLVRDGGMLRELRKGSGRQSAILIFSELLEIAEGRPGA